MPSMASCRAAILILLPRLRHDHGMADGQSVGANKSFTVGGYPIKVEEIIKFS